MSDDLHALEVGQDRAGSDRKRKRRFRSEESRKLRPKLGSEHDGPRRRHALALLRACWRASLRIGVDCRSGSSASRSFDGCREFERVYVGHCSGLAAELKRDLISGTATGLTDISGKIEAVCLTKQWTGLKKLGLPD